MQQPQTVVVSGTSTAPRKPPRRNVSVSPVRGASGGSVAMAEKVAKKPHQGYNTISTHKIRRNHDHSRQQDSKNSGSSSSASNCELFQKTILRGVQRKCATGPKMSYFLPN